jgi:hypothetical protein
LTAVLAILRQRNRALPQMELSASANQQRDKLSETGRIWRDVLVRRSIVKDPDRVGDMGGDRPWTARPTGLNFSEQI